MKLNRRSLIYSAGAAMAVSSMARVVRAAGPKNHGSARPGSGFGKHAFKGYGELQQDPNGLLDLPAGFQYVAFSRQNDELSDGGSVPGNHDGTAAFSAGRTGLWLVRNHEMSPEDVEEDGVTPVAHVAGSVYDPEVTAGGTTTLLVTHDRKLAHHRVSLAGTIDNCAGGPSPWGTWFTAEETDEIVSKPHGYVFEVDPVGGGNPEPIIPLGRFEHEAVSFDQKGIVYLTEDASEPFGSIYRFLPKAPLGGLGSLHKGGTLQALSVVGIKKDLSEAQQEGAVYRVRWIAVPNVNPGKGETPVREQAQARGATPIQKAEGTWAGLDGSIWFVSSYGRGPDAEDAEDRSAATHGGQIWRYDPKRETLELVSLFPADAAYDGPDNITAGPHGFAVAATDGEDDQYLVGITDNGDVFPFAYNREEASSEFTGPTFSEDGQTLFANIQEPGITFAIWGPWRSVKG